MAMVSMREVVHKARQVQDLMHEERRNLPSSYWEVGDNELNRFLKTPWPTLVGQKQ